MLDEARAIRSLPGEPVDATALARAAGFGVALDGVKDAEGRRQA
jgi:hypothetical protein